MSILARLQVGITAIIMSDDRGCYTCAECETASANLGYRNKTLICSVEQTKLTVCEEKFPPVSKQQKQQHIFKERSKGENAAMPHCWTPCPSQLIEQLTQSQHKAAVESEQQTKDGADFASRLFVPVCPACSVDASARVHARNTACAVSYKQTH